MDIGDLEDLEQLNLGLLHSWFSAWKQSFLEIVMAD